MKSEFGNKITKVEQKQTLNDNSLSENKKMNAFLNKMDKKKVEKSEKETLSPKVFFNTFQRENALKD
jgi:hypothetical protein